MLSPDRMQALEHAMRNVAFLFMAGMMEAMGGAMGELSQALHDAFAGPDSTRDVAAEIRSHMSQEQVQLFEEFDTAPDPIIWDRVVAALDDAAADELLAPLRVSIGGLPPLTEPLTAEAMAGYLHLLQKGDGSLDASVGMFAARMQELTAPRNLADLSAGATSALTQAAGRDVRLVIDPSCGEGMEIAPTLDLVTSIFQQLSAWGDWRQQRLAQIEEVRVRNVDSIDDAGWSFEGTRFDVAVCLAAGTEPTFSSWDVTEAISERWKREVVDEQINARATRAIKVSNGFTVEPAGVQVVAPVAPEDESDFRPFSCSPGTAVAIVVRRSSGGITRFVSESSSVQSALDDRGGNLMNAAGPSNNSAGFGSFPSVRADGTACLLEVGVPGLPAEGSSSIDLDVVLAFEIANGQNELTANVTFEPGATFEIGGVRFEVVSVDAEWGFRVDLRTEQSLATVAGYRFFASDGHEIPCQVSSSSTSGWSDSVVEERSLSFDEPAPEGKFVMLVWKDLETVTIPVKVPVRLGL